MNSKIKRIIDDVAEVSGYLWQKGWAERNGGNITVNITDEVDDEIRSLKPLCEKIAIGATLENLKGCYFFCKGTNMRMRDLARYPMDNGSIIRIMDDCAHYEIVATKIVMPTSELISHFAMHDQMIASGSGYKAALHTHPIDLIAMSHNDEFLLNKELENYDVVMWEKHGVCSVGTNIMEAFDFVDVLSKSAQIYISAR